MSWNPARLQVITVDEVMSDDGERQNEAVEAMLFKLLGDVPC